MKIWFDTEFIDNGITIDLISIGMVRQDGQTYYAESTDCDLSEAGEWVQKNVIPYLSVMGTVRKTREQIAIDIAKFAGTEPEFWAYYASYDWVALCQLYGSMMSLPPTWPKMVMDVMQLCVDKGNGNPWRLPRQLTRQHNALNDALWTRDAWRYLNNQPLKV